jgi:hypothetical protein
VNKLCEAEVVDVRGDAEIHIHYIGWPNKCVLLAFLLAFLPGVRWLLE